MTSLLICFAPLALAIRAIKMNDNLCYFQPSSEAFEKGIEEYIEGLEPSLSVMSNIHKLIQIENSPCRSVLFVR